MLEQQVREAESKPSDEPIHNVFDVVSREELGIEEHKEPEIDYKDDEIRIIESGFEAPPLKILNQKVQKSGRTTSLPKSLKLAVA